MRILVVEDDELVAEALQTLLVDLNYAVELATDGQTAAELVEAFEYDLILSDVMLPRLDGVGLCQQLRSQGYQIPILLLTGKDSSHDRAIGLDAGADDYVVKPFDPEELAARVRALLRRGEAIKPPILKWENLQLDPRACEVKYQDVLLKLTPKEYALVELLMRNTRRVFSCGMILEHVWTYEDTPGEEAVRTHIKGLRQKLKKSGAPTDLIETVYGIGYRLKPLSELHNNQGTSAQPPEVKIKQQTMNAIADIWIKFQPRIQEQINLLNQAAAAVTEGCLNDELKQSAQQEAHTLAGGLGTFGLSKGSQLAREIEHLLRSHSTLDSEQSLQFQQDVEALRREINYASQPATQVTSDRQDELGQWVVLVIDADTLSRDALATEARQHQIRYLTAESIDLARDLIQEQSPHLILFDPAGQSPIQSLTFLEALLYLPLAIPVLIWTADEERYQEMAKTYSSGQQPISKSIPLQQVWDRVEHTLQSKGGKEARILIVDDDPQILETVAALCKPWGLEVIGLDEPTQFWETLTNSPPDLLLLDVEMPQIGGIDLCRVVRNDIQWEQLPIIFLTAHTEADVVNQVYAAGADDFISKPIVGPELVVRILNRLERTRLQRRLSTIDPLARVLSRHETTHALELLLSEMAHQPRNMCLVILEIERLQQINDCFGYAVGDSILRQFAQALLGLASAEDVIARRGGNQFLVGLLGATKNEGGQRVQDFLNVVHKTPYSIPDGTNIQITCSASLVHCPEDSQDFQDLCILAEETLTEARALGWGQVRIANQSLSLPAKLHAEKG
ncbi:response regulator [Acaryochloris sp. CCMEE 5410]|uniref:response regulator n=1 Tax=Acaryochloris sp. CCMEE 5410 TaxID=310037 RepID=UPI0002EB3EC6|nr:response regulator [Acaryochloris sp. CCMEE 5410]KAI9129674.1 response regulator [Acaryochloris sp. CCMEE 5410]